MLRHSLRLTFRLKIFTAALIFSIFAFAFATHAQGARQSVPSPRAVLNFTPGDDRTIADWRQIADYFARLDRASDRVEVRNLGQTTLGRSMIVAFISAPENIRQLARFQEINARLADPRRVQGDAERDRLTREGKTVVVISCSIHSTEIVASQMSMQLAFEMATATDAETREILQNTILILIPSANPDGIDIVAEWYRRTLNTPSEGTEPPELYHHYAGHDNNRDWFMLNLRETQLLTRLFWREWFPQIVYDVHQQGPNGSRFFIPPFYDPPNPHIAPLILREVGTIGHRIAADLQAAGHQGVITNALYDTWWHGGFRSAPYYHNSIGILSEAASARLMSPTTVTREQLSRASSRGMPSALEPATNFPDPWPGGQWRPRDIMEMEMIASRAVLQMAARYREHYLQNFHLLGLRAVNRGVFERYRTRRAEQSRSLIRLPPDINPLIAYLIPPGQGRDENVSKMISTLTMQGVEVHRLERELHGRLAAPLDYGRGEAEISNEPQELPAGSYIVLFDQPYRANVLALFERQVYPDRRTASGEAERPYDVAGWTLPMQMGVETIAVRNIVEPETERRLTLIRDEQEVRRDLGLPARQGERSPIANPIAQGRRVGLYRAWTDVMDEGWTRFVFDTFNAPYRTLRDTDMRAGNLRANYDVIILPSQRAQEIINGNSPDRYPVQYAGGITDAGVENLRRFTEAGGTLICFDASTQLAIERFNLPVRNVLAGVRSSEFYGPGSILQLTVDTTHPLARGLSRDTDAYFINSAAFDITDGQRARVVARYAEQNTLRSGWLLGERYIAGKAALVEVSMGQGRVILFGFRPQHRGQTWGTFPFIWNAINGSDERGTMNETGG